MVPFETGAIVLALVAERRAKPLQPGPVLDQPLPVVVTDLVAEAPEQGAVGLAHRLSRTLACHSKGPLPGSAPEPFVNYGWA